MNWDPLSLPFMERTKNIMLLQYYIFGPILLKIKLDLLQTPNAVVNNISSQFTEKGS